MYSLHPNCTDFGYDSVLRDHKSTLADVKSSTEKGIQWFKKRVARLIRFDPTPCQPWDADTITDTMQISFETKLKLMQALNIFMPSY